MSFLYILTNWIHLHLCTKLLHVYRQEVIPALSCYRSEDDVDKFHWYTKFSSHKFSFSYTYPTWIASLQHFCFFRSLSTTVFYLFTDFIHISFLTNWSHTLVDFPLILPYFIQNSFCFSFHVVRRPYQLNLITHQIICGKMLWRLASRFSFFDAGYNGK